MRKIGVWLLILTAMSAVLIGIFTRFFNKQYTSGIKKPDAIAAFKNSNPVKITIIGDSVAKGTGDEKGSGFSTYLPEYLKGITQKDISVSNAGINGMKSTELVTQLKSLKLDSQIADADMILLSIGGNDLLTLRTVKEDQMLTALKNVQASYLDNLKEILNIIEEKNPEALIVFTGLYNPQEAGPSSILYDIALNAWNDSTAKLIKEDDTAIFIDIRDIFKSNYQSYISADKLHPSSSGYQAISEKIVQLVMGLNNK